MKGCIENISSITHISCKMEGILTGGWGLKNDRDLYHISILSVIINSLVDIKIHSRALKHNMQCIKLTECITEGGKLSVSKHVLLKI